MKAKFKAKWLKALRSGKYEQGFGSLRLHKENYCCLGVLLHCVSPRSRLLDTRGTLDERLDEFGLTEKQQERLIDLNDDERRTFESIANYIERYL
jgi:hypothetical protein